MRIKKLLYFTIASYFRFFARLKLKAWNPTIVVITGSSGKTTLLHLLESQIGKDAKYSHHANSSFGIPFDILGLQRKTLQKTEWFSLFLLAPFKVLGSHPKQRLYIVEADCDRPGEGKFVASLLRPNATLWTNSGRTHTMNFDRLVTSGAFGTVEEAVAHEFGYFIEHTKELAIVNGDSHVIHAQLLRTHAHVEKIHISRLNTYKVLEDSTEFTYDNHTVHFPYLVPQETFYALAMTERLLAHINKPADPSFSDFELPPGRSSVFSGKMGTTIVDSSYNATPDGVAAVLHMFSLYPDKHKWAVIGDMLELGNEEASEHEKLATQLSAMNLEHIILVGPRTKKYTYPLLLKSHIQVTAFEYPKDALHFLQEHIQGKETILFKGARFLEGIIEHLLEHKKDVQRLCRREAAWQKRRQQWGL